MNRVLKRKAEKKYKYSAAITFCNSRFNELRAEERRRVSTVFIVNEFKWLYIHKQKIRYLAYSHVKNLQQ